MLEQELDDIDYDHLDDLPLNDHIEYNHYVSAEAATDENAEIDWLDVA